jgi:hypothetical protein
MDDVIGLFINNENHSFEKDDIAAVTRAAMVRHKQMTAHFKIVQQGKRNGVFEQIRKDKEKLARERIENINNHGGSSVRGGRGRGRTGRPPKVTSEVRYNNESSLIKSANKRAFKSLIDTSVFSDGNVSGYVNDMCRTDVMMDICLLRHPLENLLEDFPECNIRLKVDTTLHTLKVLILSQQSAITRELFGHSLQLSNIEVLVSLPPRPGDEIGSLHVYCINNPDTKLYELSTWVQQNFPSIFHFVLYYRYNA